MPLLALAGPRSFFQQSASGLAASAGVGTTNRHLPARRGGMGATALQGLACWRAAGNIMARGWAAAGPAAGCSGQEADPEITHPGASSGGPHIHGTAPTTGRHGTAVHITHKYIMGVHALGFAPQAAVWFLMLYLSYVRSGRLCAGLTELPTPAQRVVAVARWSVPSRGCMPRGALRTDGTGRWASHAGITPLRGSTHQTGRDFKE